MIYFKDIVEKAAQLAAPVVGGEKLSTDTLNADAAIIEKLIRGEGRGLPKISMKEALQTADASVLFTKVINDQLTLPVERDAIFSTILAKVVSSGNAKTIIFPTIGSITAGLVSEAGDYPTSTPGMSEVALEISTAKHGVMIPVSSEVIEDSQWDILGLCVEAGRRAMVREKEELCSDTFAKNSTVVFDNKYSATAAKNQAAQTTGIGKDGKFNGTLSFRDIVDAMGVLATNGYTPTDITVHPMIWSVFAKDPILQFLMLQNGQGTPMITNIGPGNISQNIPWAFNVNVTPYMPYNNADTIKISNGAPGSEAFGGNITAATSDIYISDRSNSLVIAQRSPLAVENLQDPSKDILMLKFSERYSTGMLNGGKGATAIKNIVISDNNEAVFTVRTIDA